VKSFDDAVRDIPEGATLGFGGFAVVGMPINLHGAVAMQGARNLTCVSNSKRGGATLPADAILAGLDQSLEVALAIHHFSSQLSGSAA
jgi:acyl CoA:acetate/3-ketoacid CoA transferase alpha subunit